MKFVNWFEILFYLFIIKVAKKFYLGITSSIAFALLGILTSCDIETAPGTMPDQANEPRDYRWKIDTLFYPRSGQTMMLGVWASSPNNVYLVGHNSEPFGKMYHYDGSKWSNVRLSSEEGGTISNIGSLNAIYGFSQNDIWAVGNKIFFQGNSFSEKGLVIHYDGMRWDEIHLDAEPELRTIWGSDPYNLWTGGDSKYLYHYREGTWRVDSLPLSVTHSDEVFIYSISGRGREELFLVADVYYANRAVFSYFFVWTPIQKWLVADSATVAIPWGKGCLWTSNSGVLYSAGGRVSRREQNSWRTLYTPRGFLGDIIGRNDQNIFVAGAFGTLAHYNGMDWFQYDQFADRNVVFTGISPHEGEAFVVGFTVSHPQKTIVLHGK